jgi:hypothetical protein
MWYSQTSGGIPENHFSGLMWTRALFRSYVRHSTHQHRQKIVGINGNYGVETITPLSFPWKRESRTFKEKTGFLLPQEWRKKRLPQRGHLFRAKSRMRRRFLHDKVWEFISNTWKQMVSWTWFSISFCPKGEILKRVQDDKSVKFKIFFVRVYFNFTPLEIMPRWNF